MRFARILALLLALAIIGISIYLLSRMPYAWMALVPANFGVLVTLFYWRTSPKRKKARRAAAYASLFLVPCLVASGAVSLFVSPMRVWPAFLALAALALIVAIIAATRITRKQAHMWADYYSDVG